MARFKQVDGVRRQMTAEEEAAKDADEAKNIAEDQANQYKINRKNQYPSWQDQLDMQYWDKINATSIWSDLITKIKSDNPKE
mgnify:FL=1